MYLNLPIIAGTSVTSGESATSVRKFDTPVVEKGAGDTELMFSGTCSRKSSRIISGTYNKQNF